MNRSDVENRHAHWNAIIQEAEKSGMPYSSWCREHDVKLSQFYRWRRKLRESNTEKKTGSNKKPKTVQEDIPETVFCEIKAPTAEVTSLHDVITDEMSGFVPEAMLLIGQVRLLVGSGVSEETLKTILSVLSHV